MGRSGMPQSVRLETSRLCSQGSAQAPSSWSRAATTESSVCTLADFPPRGPSISAFSVAESLGNDARDIGTGPAQRGLCALPTGGCSNASPARVARSFAEPHWPSGTPDSLAEGCLEDEELPMSPHCDRRVVRPACRPSCPFRLAPPDKHVCPEKKCRSRSY
jgi:hypothetical protein